MTDLARVHLRGEKESGFGVLLFFSIANLRNPSTMALAYRGKGCLSQATRNPEAEPPRFSPEFTNIIQDLDSF